MGRNSWMNCKVIEMPILDHKRKIKLIGRKKVFSKLIFPLLGGILSSQSQSIFCLYFIFEFANICVILVYDWKE